MPTKFQIRRTSITGRVANTTDPGNTHYIATGELAINLIDGKMFSSNGSVMFEIGANLTSINIASILSIGNSSSNVVANSSSIKIGTSLTGNTSGLTLTGYANVGGNVYVGNSTVFWTANSTEIDIGNATINTTAITVGANVRSNTSALLIGNSSVNSVLTATSLDVDGIINVGNTTIAGFANISQSLRIGTTLIANGGTGTADQLLYANSTGGIYWRTPATITATEPTDVGSTSNGHVFYVY